MKTRHWVFLISLFIGLFSLTKFCYIPLVSFLNSYVNTHTCKSLTMNKLTKLFIKNSEVSPALLKDYSIKLPIKRLFFDSIDSTQLWSMKNADDIYKSLSLNQSKDWIEVSAGEQTSGIGTRPTASTKHRTWLTPKNQYASTFIVPWPSDKLDLLKNVSQTAALAILEALKDIGIISKIKWINDILVEDKKISGILSNHLGSFTHTDTGSYSKVLIGIGLNINLDPSLKSEIQQPITSISEHIPDKARIPTLEVLSEKISYHLYNEINQLLEEGFSNLRDKIYTNLCWINEYIQLSTDQNVYYGIYLGINEHGHLILQIDEGEKTFQFGHISKA